MSGRKPWRKGSRYHSQWVSGSMALDSFEADGFAFADKPTTTRDVAFWQQASSGRAAPTKRQPVTALALYVEPIKLATIIPLPPPTRAAYMAWRAEWRTAGGTRRTELHELILGYMEMQAAKLEVSKTQKTALSAA